MTPETVTPTKFRAADGTVYERTGEKRTPEVGELHWCDATRPAPYPFDWPPATHWEPREDWPPQGYQCTDPDGTTEIEGNPDRKFSNYLAPQHRPCRNCGKAAPGHRGYTGTRGEPLLCPQVHKCAIWKVSDDQTWTPPAPVASQDNPIDSLIDKLKTTAGDLESIPVLAMLYQAKALERIADGISEQNAHLWRIADALRANAGPRPATNADLLGVGAYVCSNCQHNEHQECMSPSECYCTVCHAPPTPYPPHGVITAMKHRFEGMEDNHFCTQCGGGRLHPIHQTA